jgi:hypothetical protein
MWCFVLRLSQFRLVLGLVLGLLLGLVLAIVHHLFLASLGRLGLIARVHAPGLPH